MMSGHAGIVAAVAAIKAGAYDFLEKPLHMEVLLDKVESALKHRPSGGGAALPSDTRLEIASADLSMAPGAVEVVDSAEPQRTLRGNVVLNGIGLLSGRNTGIILSPSVSTRGSSTRRWTARPSADISPRLNISPSPAHPRPSPPTPPPWTTASGGCARSST